MIREDITSIAEDVISIAEEFNEWLENIAEEYEWDKDDVQILIKQILM